ncbi:P-loop containing nucleoside triphosphate hydrolase protein [Sparassis crispa]|uniref:RNA helicase n=1 Tax=Sparassis crispa TaxID=139825 RepID=A0A401H3W8_9APHY|nr:P-loop containing nucleoside triphosphate hydrolase protein [Sparassis crispa]GBE89135.1 P-loop containing nucleoside triphosphate hydrolase protein [Sparassis crispa]
MVFKDTVLQQQFVIVRLVKAIVGSQADHELLKPKSPYVPRKHTTREPEREVVSGVPPESKNTIPYVVKLPRAEIPNRISSALSKGSSANIITFFRQSVLPSTLDNKTHGQHFKALIWAEEHRTELDLAIYDINGTQLNRHNRYYYLAVPGLAEKRPSVLVGDLIMVHPHDSLEGKWYEGYVHVVHREEVGLCLNGSYRGHSESQRYNIRFKLNRIPLRRQHQALDTAFYPDRILFPLVAHVSTGNPPSVATMKAGIHNKLIANNPAQLQAVTSIVYHPAGAPPFVVFGPPGTGKTITIVEAIMQLINHNPQARILACAPSNSAADLIASRLINKLSNAELFRFYAPSRFKDQVPDALLTYSYRTASGHHSVPPVATLKRYRVIVSTCVSAGFTYGVGMPRGHFSHIFVDEAGQATEPEVMIAVKTMADNSTNVVLSGDPKQLGPIIRSPIARELGLEVSYLERLMQREPYDEQAGYGKSVVKLVQNFRSHENILRFPNERFYHGDLRPCGDAGVINSFIGSSILVSKNFPIIVHAISGRDLREASSPSFFNIDEVTQVKEYVQLLRADRRVRITDADIGVIAPYHAQCQKIRAVLRPIADGVKVGSVEEFQGQERRVIIISTVRSSREFVKYDLKHTLGFVANPRRFNVAVTRAQALLIVVGDPSVLSLDPLWRSFLNYAHINGGWRGNAPSWDTLAPVETGSDFSGQVRESRLANMDDFARRMEALTLEGVADGVLQDDDLDVNVDRPWREVE